MSVFNGAVHHLHRVNLFSATFTKCESDILHFALNTMIYVDKYRNIVYNIGEKRL